MHTCSLDTEVDSLIFSLYLQFFMIHWEVNEARAGGEDISR